MAQTCNYDAAPPHDDDAAAIGCGGPATLSNGRATLRLIDRNSTQGGSSVAQQLTLTFVVQGKVSRSSFLLKKFTQLITATRTEKFH